MLGGYSVLTTQTVSYTITGLNNLYNVRLIANVFFIDVGTLPGDSSDSWAGKSITVKYNTVTKGSIAYPGSTGASNICGAARA